MYTADFETATWFPDRTYVWAWALCNINDINDLKVGNTIDSFFEEVEKIHNPKIYFHNLKFDGEFIIYYLLKNGFTHIRDRKNRKDKTFTTLISDVGMFYQIEVFLNVGNKKVNKLTFIDSLKIIPLPVKKIPKAFGIPYEKLEIDYDEPREEDHILTEQEYNYIKNDVVIVALALKVMFEEELTSITIGSNAVKNFKKTHSKRRFNRLFPNIDFEMDEDMRAAYKGGFTYLNPIYAGKDVGEGVVLDVNSLYPSQMRYKPMPFGEPKFFTGKYEEDLIYPLYIQRLTCSFKIKENKIPTIQIKKSYFTDNEYLTSSNNEIVGLTLSNIDLKLFLEQYDVFDLKYKSGWKFKSMNGIFDEYIDKWINVKIEATKNKNYGLRTLAKLLLNSLYGKFATSQRMQEKYPFIENDIIKYSLSEVSTKKGFYLPIGIFITSYAREVTIRTSQAIKDYSINKYGKDMYIYSDTDSIHTLLPIEELHKFCEIDDTALGKWKHEATFTRARFIRQKCYLEEIEGDIKITCAGMPETCYSNVTWNEFKTGFSCGGKLTFSHVKGGVKLVETDFTIKEDKKFIENLKEFDNFK